MTSNSGNYALHAAIWDWGGYDRTDEHEYWCNYAAQYGKNVLIPFCAIGETGAYMAHKGFTVTAFDIVAEMIAEGRKRFGGISGLQLLESDVTSFHFDIPPVDFCFTVDFGHIHTMGKVKKALSCISHHMREGGVFNIQTGLPPKASDYFPPQTFYPKEEVYPDRKVWKTGDLRSDAKSGRLFYSQTVYIESRSGKVEKFDHSFYLQCYHRADWVAALEECGFDLQHEYRNREKEPWSENDGFWIADMIKARDIK